MRKTLSLLLALLVPTQQSAGASATSAQRRRSQAPVPQRAQPALQRLPSHVCKLIYVATIINPVLSVVANEYKVAADHTLVRFLPSPLRPYTSQGNPTAAVYRTLFYFAKLKPRLLFAVGACLRALQQTTVIHMVFDPSVGVGAGLNLLALATASRWPSALLLGWAASKPFWTLLGASPPDPKVQVPIHINF